MKSLSPLLLPLSLYILLAGCKNSENVISPATGFDPTHPWEFTLLSQGTVDCFALDGTSLFAGRSLDAGGVFVSTNNGLTWNPIGLSNNNVRALATSGNNLFAGTNTGVFLYSAHDTTWSPTSLKNTVVLALAVSGTYVFAGGESGIFLSSNSGATWTQINDGLLATTIWALAASGMKVFAATIDRGVFQSTDFGTHWTQSNAGLTDTVVRVLTVSGTDLFAGTNNGVFLSTNNGISWTPIGLTKVIVSALGASGANLFAGSYVGEVFFHSADSPTWTTCNTGFPYTSVYAFAFSGGYVFAGTGVGVWRQRL